MNYPTAPDALRWLKSGLKDLTIQTTGPNAGDAIRLKDADKFPNLILIGKDVFVTSAELNKAKREAKATHHPTTQPIPPDPNATAQMIRQISANVASLDIPNSGR